MENTLKSMDIHFKSDHWFLKISKILCHNWIKALHFLGCILLVFALFCPFIAFDKTKAYEKSDHSISQLQEERNLIQKNHSNYSAIHLCRENSCEVLIILFLFSLVDAIFLAFASQYIWAFLLEFIGSGLICAYIIVEVSNHNILSQLHMHYSMGLFLMILSWILLITSCIIHVWKKSSNASIEPISKLVKHGMAK